MTDDEILAALADELQAREAPIEIVLRPVSAFQLAGVLQLALRHPGLDGDARRVAVTLIEHVRAYFAEAPTVSDVLRRGDDPAEDR